MVKTKTHWLDETMLACWRDVRHDVDTGDGFTSLVYNRFRGFIQLFRYIQQEPLRLVWYIHDGDDHYQRKEYYDP